ncbi:N-acetylmuramoyl-L-alanine amidase family protein [Paenibacillus physcomitrellae]|uniref:MurNAc-LAA domain-containing protein n=1 Tax=Paenibacillus physcomitrellae TaxID=1619311 RepID=A0ABQ1FNA2_9BACL|nr:N-acetylmuramoyl-L-alanine amidase family protein [Paenibacillus physcomitrellae]GGA23660.1 hypothetical protein GCM10010917_05500 [Paenibacillus physcomitrellae]
MKKYGFFAFLLLLLLILPGIGHAAANTANINLDGKDLNLGDNGGVETINGSVMVPLRLVTENMGYKVEYDNKSQAVTIQKAKTVLKLVVGEQSALVNGKEINMPGPAVFAGSGKTQTTLVPLRFVGEQTGAEVSWDNKTKTVYITSAVSGSQETVLPGTGSAGETGGTPVDVPAPDQTAGGSEGAGAPSGSASTAEFTGLSFGEGKLLLAVNGKVTPSVFTISAPDRIVVDLPGATFSQTFGSQLPLNEAFSGQIDVQETSKVKDVRYALFSSSPASVRVVLDLTSPAAYKVIDNQDGLITIDLNEDAMGQSGSGQTTDPSQPATTPPAGTTGKKVIVIDAGHGGSDPGAISLNNRNEKDFTLATVLKLQQVLAADSRIEVVLTRSGDTYPTLQDRVALANSLKADVFVSIHGNKSPDGGPGPKGIETHYTNKNSESLAKIMQKHLVQASGMSDRGLKTGNLYVTKNTKMPAVLLECGFLSNPKDEAAMFSDEFQQQLAEGIAAGLKEFLGL